MAKVFINVLFQISIIFILLTNIFATDNCDNIGDVLLAADSFEEQCIQEESNTELFPSSSDYGMTSSTSRKSNDISDKPVIGTDSITVENLKSGLVVTEKEGIINFYTNGDFKDTSLSHGNEGLLHENSFENGNDEISEFSTNPSQIFDHTYSDDLPEDKFDNGKEMFDNASQTSLSPLTATVTLIENVIGDNDNEFQNGQNNGNPEIEIKNQQNLKINSEDYLSDDTDTKNNEEGIRANKLIGEFQPSIYEREDNKGIKRILYEATTELKAEISDNNLNYKDFMIRKPSNNANEKDGWRFNFGDLSESCGDCDLDILPLRAAAQKDKFKDTSTSIPEVSIQFAEVPRGNEYQVDKLDISEGTFLFNYLRDFLSWLQPHDFPVELMRDALRNQISITELITKSLQLEVGFVACLVVGVLLALAAPIVVFSHTCYRLRRRNRDDNDSDDTWSGNCRRRTLVFMLQILIILLLIGIIGVVTTNQQVSNSMLQSENVLHTVLSDLDSFLGNAHLQMHFAVTKHLEQAVQAADSDINNVEVLLGQPIQIELSRETGLDVALDSLRNIAQDANKVAELVELVQLAAGLVSEAMLLARDKLSDLRLQVDSFKRQCAARDRPLCDTISINGLDIAMNVDFLRQDEKLKRVRQLGGPELRTVVESTRLLYKEIPRRVDIDTRTARQDLHRQLDQQRTWIDESIRTLETFFRGLRSKVTNSQNSLHDMSSNIPEMEYYRWIIGLGAAVSILLVLALLQSGISCGCCGSEKSAAPTLLVCVVLICLVSTALWILALIVLLVGGHGQVFVCRPLYQEPDFPALSQLMDHPGIVPSSHNFLSTLAYNNETMDVPFDRILRECRHDRAAYPTFQLKGVFNIDSVSESRQWDSFQKKLEKINVKLDHVKLLSPELYAQLDELLQGLSVNLTAHRIQLSEPLTGKDLNAFAAQLDSVGNQLKDLATVSRIETLASRTRRLIATHIDPLKEKKENLVYQLTALEVQLGPLHHQVEQSVSHLKTIQFFINSQGNSIAEKKTLEYKNRLTSYIDQYRIHLTDMVNNDIARCQPLWNLFHTTRLMLCKNVMDPLNGFWFSIVWCLILFLCATPISLKLVDYYRLRSHSDMSNNLSGSPSKSLVPNEQGKDWALPNGNTENNGSGGW